MGEGERGGPAQRGRKEGKEGEQRHGGRDAITEDAEITEYAAIKEAGMARGRVGCAVKKNDVGRGAPSRLH